MNKNKLKDKLVDELFQELRSNDNKEMFGSEGLITDLTSRLVKKMLEAEMDEHLGCRHGERNDERRANHRNGTSSKTLKSEIGDVKIEVPRDRKGSFEPKIVKKHQTKLGKLEGAVISLYARGMSTREIQDHMSELYGSSITPSLVARITNVVIDDVRAGRNRALEAIWPIVYLDAIVLPIRDGGIVKRKSMYLAIGVNREGIKEVLGMWIEQSEGASFWREILTQLKARGIEDILIACVDGLKGFPAALEAVFPRTTVQTCIVHMIRNSASYATWSDRKKVCRDLRPVYTAPTVEAAQLALKVFEENWGAKYPMIVRSWQANWERVIPFLAFEPDLRKVLYTTNAIESFNARVRKLVRVRGHFVSDEAALKLVYLAVQNAQKRWTRPLQFWKSAKQQLMLHFDGRLPV